MGGVGVSPGVDAHPQGCQGQVDALGFRSPETCKGTGLSQRAAANSLARSPILKLGCQ